MDIDEVIEHFRRGTLEFDCKQIVLTQNKDGGDRFEGPGYIRQSVDGTLIFKTYVIEHTAKPFGHFDSKLGGVPGKVHPGEMFYDLHARADDGTIWTASRILVSPHWDFSDLSVIVYGQMQFMTAAMEWPHTHYYLRLNYFDEYDVPLHYMSEVEKLGNRRFLTRDRSEFEACGSKFEVRKRSGSGETVVEATSETAFPECFNLRVQEALQYITGKTAVWRSRLEAEGNELHLELASPYRKSARTQFGPPISAASTHFLQQGWKLFEKYLTYVTEKTRGTQWNPVAYHLYNACEATANSLDAWAVGVSVAVEAVSSLITIENTEQDGRKVAQLATYQDRARKWLADQPDLANIADRVRGHIDAIGQRRAKDTLYALARAGRAEKSYVDAWDYLRNRHVHPTLSDLQKPTPVDYQKLLDHIHRAEVLLRQLTFHLIGYEGPFTDYGTLGFPTRHYPLTGQDEAIQ